MKTIISIGCVLISLFSSTSYADGVYIHPKPMEQAEVPKELQDWTDWVQYNNGLSKTTKDCIKTSDNPNGFCLKTSKLNISTTQKEMSININLEVLADNIDLELPAPKEGWPIKILGNNKELTVLQKNNKPIIQLQKGKYLISGHYIANNIDTITIPTWVTRISATKDNVKTPYTRMGEQIWLSTNKLSNVNINEKKQDNTTLQFYNLIQDNQPSTLTTWVSIDHTGSSKKENIGKIIPNNTKPLRLVNSGIPANFSNDGTLEVELKQGHWVVQIESVYTEQPSAISNTISQKELWAFSANPKMRQVSIEGGKQVDPSMPGIPEDMKNLPIYENNKGQVITIKTVDRGPQLATDKLALLKDIWLNIDGESWQTKDFWRGNISTSRRYESKGGTLEKIEYMNNVVPISIQQEYEGVEVYPGNVQLLVESYQKEKTISLTGGKWEATTADVSLHLPPGYRLMHFDKDNYTEGAWTHNWSLWGFFIVMLFSLGVLKLSGKIIYATGAGIASIVMMYEPSTPIVSLYMATFFVILAKYTYSNKLKNISFLFIATSAFSGLLFTIVQIRNSIYPEFTQSIIGNGGTLYPNNHSLIYVYDFFWVTFLVTIMLGVLHYIFKPQDNELEQPKQKSKKNIVIGLLVAFAIWSIYESLTSVSSGSATGGMANKMSSDGYYAPQEAAAPAPAVEVAPSPSSIGNVANSIQMSDKIISTRKILNAPESPEQENLQERNVNKDPYHTGIGLPDWTGEVYTIHYNGKQPANTQIVPIIFNRAQLAIWNMVGVLGFWIVLLMVFRENKPDTDENPNSGDKLQDKIKNMVTKIGKSLATVFLLVGMFNYSDNTWAMEANPEQPQVQDGGAVEPQPPQIKEIKPNNIKPVNPAILTELEKRIAKHNKCLNVECSVLEGLTIYTDNNILNIDMTWSSEPNWIANLPRISGVDESSISITLNNNEPYEVAKNVIVLNGGRNKITIKANITSDNIGLDFLNTPKFLTIANDKNWESSIANISQWNNSIILTKTQTQKTDPDKLAQDSITPVVKLSRTLLLGREWKVQYQATVLNPSDEPVSISIPLIKNEKILSQEVHEDLGKQVINIPKNTQSISWTTSLPISDIVSIQSNPTLNEEWFVRADSMWHVEWEGTPAISSAEILNFAPINNEKLNLKISKPISKKGRLAKLDYWNVLFNTHEKDMDGKIETIINSSIGQEQQIELPENTKITSITKNGQEQYISVQKNKLTVQLNPGVNKFVIAYEMPFEWSFKTTMPHIYSNIDGTNQTIKLNTDQDRVVLFLSGPGWHSIIPFFSVILGLFMFAFILSKIPNSPFKPWQWLLLLLGLYPLHVFAILPIALIFVTYNKTTPTNIHWGFYQKTFITLAIMSFFAVMFVLHTGLVDYPRYIIALTPYLPIQDELGYAKYVWYMDNAKWDKLYATVWSISIQQFKIIMFIWAIWMVRIFIKMMGFGFNKFSQRITKSNKLINLVGE